MNRMVTLALGLAAAAMTGAVQAAPAAVFVEHAAMGDYTEMQMGRLALRHGVSRGVRGFGQRLMHDHGAHLREVHVLAARLHVRIRDEFSAGAQAHYRMLDRLRGGAFDRAFARHMVEDHREDIEEFEAQARDGDAVTAAFARATLPTLNLHLRIAQGLARR